MKTIDRYIIRQFLVNFVILLVVLIGMIIMIDFVLQMDEFVKEARRITKADETTNVVWEMIKTTGGFYLPFVPLLYVFLSGLVSVAAMGFTFLAMSRAGELVALAASGVSMYRVAAPVLVVGAILNSVTLINQEYVIPPLAPKLMRKHAHLQNETMKQFHIWLTPDDKGTLVSGLFIPSEHEPRIEKVTILVRNDKGQTTRRLTAAQAFWNSNRQGWELVGMDEMRWAGQGGQTQLEMRSADGRDGSQPAVNSPGGVADSGEFFRTSLSPQVIMAKQRTLFARLLSMRDLQGLLANPNVDRSQIIKILHSRLSLLVMNVLILAMGLPYFLSVNPGNPLRQTVGAAGVCMGAWFTGLVILQIPAQQLNPVTSAWLPVAMFVVLAAWLMTRVKT